MVRFNDKPQITTAELTGTDILPITDVEDSVSDKKVSINQLNTFFGDNITTFATKDLANTGMLADAIISAPNGVIVASSDNTSIIVKNGLKILFSNGRTSDKRFNVTEYTVSSDISQIISTLSNDIYELFISNNGTIIYTPLDNVYVSRNAPTVTTTVAYWYDIISNYWKYTSNTGSTWSNVTINALGQFTVVSGVLTNVTPNTVAYIPNPEAVMVRDLSNITEVGENTIKDLVLPLQSGQSGKYLTTNGVTTSWATIQQAPSTDDVTINLNSDDELQAIGVIDSRDNSTALKYWTGTSAQYDAVSTKSSTTLYNVQNQGLYLGSTRISSNYTPPILSTICADHTLNDVSWLRSDTFSWQSGNVYTTAYNHLVSDISDITPETETIGSYTVTFYRATDGHKICLANQETTVSNIYTESGIAWYYILDTTNIRFKLPRTKWGFEGLRDNVGDYISESLPNITGQAYFNGDTAGASSGALTTLKYSNQGYERSSTGTMVIGVSLNASESSSTYQNNAPVQERATQMYLYFYVGEYTQSAIEQTAGITTEQLNNKVDLNASNLNTAGKSLISGLGMPSNRYTTLTVGASGSTYTAPANGYYAVNVVWSSSASWVALTNTSASGICGYVQTGTSGASNGITYVPVRKNDVVELGYNLISSFTYFRFIYAEGDE